jgi:hypothetical protein
MPSPVGSHDVLWLWRQELATRLLAMQLVFGFPLLLWTVPQMVTNGAWLRKPFTSAQAVATVAQVLPTKS